MRPSCLTYTAKHLSVGLSIYFSDRILVTKRSFQGGKKAKEIACLRLLLFLINRSHYFVLSPCHLSQRHSSTLQLQTAETQVATGCSIIFLEEGTVKETQGKPYPHNLYSRPSSSLAFFGICYTLRGMLSSSPFLCRFQNHRLAQRCYDYPNFSKV